IKIRSVIHPCPSSFLPQPFDRLRVLCISLSCKRQGLIQQHPGCRRDQVVMPPVTGSEIIQAGRAFHSHLPHSFSAKFSFSTDIHGFRLLIGHSIHQLLHRKIFVQRNIRRSHCWFHLLYRRSHHISLHLGLTIELVHHALAGAGFCRTSRIHHISSGSVPGIAVLTTVVRLSGINRLSSIRGSTYGSFRILRRCRDSRIHLRRIIAFSHVRKLDTITRIRECPSHGGSLCHL